MRTTVINQCYFENFTTLGKHAHFIGDLQTAKRRYRQAKIAVKDLQNNRFEVATLAVNIARLYRDCGQYKRSELVYKRALFLFDELEMAAHLAIVHLELAELAVIQGKFKAAESAYRNAIARDLTGAATINEVALIAYRLAGRFNDRGQVADAMKLLRFVEKLKYNCHLI